MRILAILLLLYSIAQANNAQQQTTSDASPLTILVSVPPQAYFVRAIGKDTITINTIVPPESSPETYEPKLSQIRAFAQARIFFGVGMPYEAPYFSRIQQTNKNISYINLGKLLHNIKSNYTHDHNHAYDPHIWLSLTAIKPQAMAIYQALAALNPSKESFYKQNLIALLAKIDTIKNDLDAILMPHKGKAFLVIHPAFSYFAKDFGLEEFALEEEGKEAKIKSLSQMPELIRQKKITTLFMQPQFDRTRAESIAKMLNLKLEILDPLSEDWEANLYSIAQKITMP